MTEDRRQRHLKILELITTHAIRTQEELADALAREGWEVTQSSVSRDIAALRLIKVAGVYQRPAAAQRRRPDPDEQRIAEGVLAIEPAGDALLVLHTPPGEANRVGAALDRLAWPEVLGNISGDDTIFVAVRNPTAQRKVSGAIRKLSGSLT
jgi:transcriptional regulator of arginine metabolism